MPISKHLNAQWVCQYPNIWMHNECANIHTSERTRSVSMSIHLNAQGVCQYPNIWMHKECVNIQTSECLMSVPISKHLNAQSVLFQDEWWVAAYWLCLQEQECIFTQHFSASFFPPSNPPFHQQRSRWHKRQGREELESWQIEISKNIHLVTTSGRLGVCWKSAISVEPGAGQRQESP